MTTVNSVQAEFWFATGLHVHHYLNGTLTTVSNPGGYYLPYGVIGTDDRVYIERSESYAPIGYVGSASLGDLAPWGPYDDPLDGEYLIDGQTWYRFQNHGVGLCRLGDDIFVSTLMDIVGASPPGENGTAAGVTVSQSGALVQITGRSPDNLIESTLDYQGVTYDATRNRIWVSNDYYGLHYIDVATNQYVWSPYGGSTYKWIEYQQSTDTLWATYWLDGVIVAIDPDAVVLGGSTPVRSSIPFGEDTGDEGPYSAEVFAILPNDTHMVIAGEGGAETDYNDGIWMVELATGARELVIGLDGSEDYWYFSDAFVSIWAAPLTPPPTMAGNITERRRNFWRTAPSLGQTYG